MKRLFFMPYKLHDFLKSRNTALGTEELSASMDSVSNTVNTTSSDMQVISNASEQQTLSMKEITSSAQTLTHMAEKLQQSVDRFKI